MVGFIEGRQISEPIQKSKKAYWSLLAVYVTAAVIFGFVLQFTTILERQELQTINRRFEARQWLVWSKESLHRLNPFMLWDYHEAHEYPRSIFSWDYTLSWLIQNNHPKVCNKIIIFNHTVEDEPPADAIKEFPWMKPLLNYPISRKTVGEMVDFLAKAGAKSIILDSDFPQYSLEDKDLALAIHRASSGVYNNKSVPVFMVRALNKGSTSQIVRMETPTSPVGVLEQLSILEPGVDVESKYTGMTSIDQDKDQVVRRIFTRLPSGTSGVLHESIIVKVLESLGIKLPNLPTLMDIDFICPPNSDLFPVRPLSYLLDPEQKEKLLSENPYNDINVKDAIVIVGDGITDVYSTPFTNEGIDLMSGPELLAQAIDTISRGSIPRRLESFGSYIYIFVLSCFGGAVWLAWKAWQQRISFSSNERGQRASIFRLASDTLFFCLILTGAYIIACIIFAYSGLLVPIFVPSIALGIGTLAAIVWERERERDDAFTMRLEAANEKFVLETEKLESELARQTVESENRTMLQDRKRRYEFVRRINHDLNAPVSVLNWTISELQMIDVENSVVKERISRLVKASDKLGELIDQLVQSYDYETLPSEMNNQAALCDLASVLDDCVDGQKPLAEKYLDQLVWEKPEKPAWVKANSLELSRVIDNIIRNAIKHNPKDTTVIISLETNGSFHKVIVSDTGNGISQDHVSRIFEPGYRVNPEKTDGHGLGLDIAKTLVESMGGEISVTSTLGKGTTFKLKLPICSEARAMHEDFSVDNQVLQETLEDYPKAIDQSRKDTIEIVKQISGERK